VVRVPYDRHLETGAEIILDELAPATHRAYVRLAAAVADGFPAPPASGPASPIAIIRPGGAVSGGSARPLLRGAHADLRVRLHRVRRPHRGGSVDSRPPPD